MFVCIEQNHVRRRMYQRIEPRWRARHPATLRADTNCRGRSSERRRTRHCQEKRASDLATLHGRIAWMESSIIEIIISEAQNEVKDFQKWEFDIIPHREQMKRGFTYASGKTLAVEDAFKDPESNT